MFIVFDYAEHCLHFATRRVTWSPQHFRATLQGYFLPESQAGAQGVTTGGGRFGRSRGIGYAFKERFLWSRIVIKM
jgi:hypothetical protein